MATKGEGGHEIKSEEDMKTRKRGRREGEEKEKDDVIEGGKDDKRERTDKITEKKY